MCPAGGRDGQGVSLICHPATYANICLTAPKPWRRRGGYSCWHRLGLLSAPPPPGRNGDGEEEALKLELADMVQGLGLPPPPLSPHLFQKQHPSLSPRLFLPRHGVGIGQRPARPLVGSERAQGMNPSHSAGYLGSTFPSYPHTLTPQPASQEEGRSQGTWRPLPRTALRTGRAARPVGSPKPVPRAHSPDAPNPAGPAFPSASDPVFPYLPSGGPLPQRRPRICPPRKPRYLGCPPWLLPIPGRRLRE